MQLPLMDDLQKSQPVSAPTRSSVSARTAVWHRRAAERVAKMHQRFGSAPEGTKCQGCASFVARGHHDGTHRKCVKAGVSCSEATDWRGKWPACGAFEAKEASR
jgi:hypothetical protein